MRMVEADLVIMPVTTLMLGANVGIGRSLGVAGGGMTHCNGNRETVKP